MEIKIKLPDEPGEELLNLIKGLFIAQGTTLSAVLSNMKPPIHQSNAKDALIGKWEGRRARCVRQVLIQMATGQEIERHQVPRRKEED